MNAGRVARLLWHLLALVVLVVSGTYLLLYLYRWEWNRALVSGLFFVAAEVVLVGSTILGRLGRLERLFEEEHRPASTALPASSVVKVGMEGESSSFAWLDPGEGLGVFVPVLMGIGVVLSAVAYLVERIAAATAPTIGDQGTARRLAPLDPVRGGLIPSTRTRGVPPDRDWDLASSGPRLVHVGSALSGVVVLLVSGLLATALGSVLWDVAVNRPDPELLGERSSLEISIGQKGEDADPAGHVAEALWISCRGTLPEGVQATAIEPLGADRVHMTLEPAIGRNSQRRFVGCLEDATLDLVQAEVTRFENVPV